MVKLLGLVAMLVVSHTVLPPAAPLRADSDLLERPVGSRRSGAELAVGARAADPPRLVLAYFGGTDLPRSVRQSIGPEIEEVFADVPLELAWVDGTSIRPPASPLLRVILIDRVPAEWGLAPNVLGAVIGTEFPATVVYVFHRNVLRELHATTMSRSFYPDVARAIGRVVAHELVHAFAPRHEHRRRGLMATALGADALARRPTRIDPACAEALLSGVVAARTPAGDD